MSYLRNLFLFADSGVQHIFCCLFLRLVYPILSFSGLLIAPLVISKVYLHLFKMVIYDEYNSTERLVYNVQYN